MLEAAWLCCMPTDVVLVALCKNQGWADAVVFVPAHNIVNAPHHIIYHGYEKQQSSKKGSCVVEPAYDVSINDRNATRLVLVLMSF